MMEDTLRCFTAAYLFLVFVVTLTLGFDAAARMSTCVLVLSGVVYLILHGTRIGE